MIEFTMAASTLPPSAYTYKPGSTPASALVALLMSALTRHRLELAHHVGLAPDGDGKAVTQPAQEAVDVGHGVRKYGATPKSATMSPRLPLSCR
jgi:hypothetical protein